MLEFLGLYLPDMKTLLLIFVFELLLSGWFIYLFRQRLKRTSGCHKPPF